MQSMNYQIQYIVYSFISIRDPLRQYSFRYTPCGQHPIKSLERRHCLLTALSPYLFTGLSSIMLLSTVLGVIVIARNGDRCNLYQDPYNYAASNAETTALGEVCI